jgi:putative FmdB family regulatory protein
MPIYYYRCDECGREFERRQRMTDEPVRACPACDGTVRRIIQPVGIIFKGSGFYITDNRQVSSPTLTPPKDEGKGKAEKGETAVDSTTGPTSTVETAQETPPSKTDSDA